MVDRPTDRSILRSVRVKPSQGDSSGSSGGGGLSTSPRPHLSHNDLPVFMAASMHSYQLAATTGMEGSSPGPVPNSSLRQRRYSEGDEEECQSTDDEVATLEDDGLSIPVEVTVAKEVAKEGEASIGDVEVKVREEGDDVRGERDGGGKSDGNGSKDAARRGVNTAATEIEEQHSAAVSSSSLSGSGLQSVFAADLGDAQ